MDDFRRIFKDLDDSALIDIEEYGQLLGITPAAMAQRRHTGDLAEPCIQGGKLLRWRAGDVRAWLRELNQDTRKPAMGPSRRLGRPRREAATRAVALGSAA